ncbi:MULTISPECIES: quinoprotein dehydrogenase-associated SoxYZ-like carrier [Hyphomicrobium]|uniref:quinoprotein dehydrogenase-associated SoxYZ-like carrier n=1 Tax=Hyphomicrobium TaxID=81 RepID=UPI00036D6B53|nr:MULTISPECIES: quinoprotein dehydrogenase-associated SoxYZ-like carrier [Hyphomicrobium]WBT39347.1 quinoprotein dehydrogenase-associated SoxYZ-like carrier [Hyphomicrobium sp. DMF-1]HML43181.1 quinoprotein dehydrogenase-associated SoxYZ-like carrier [Hyphomicrobium zavarzinii]
MSRIFKVGGLVSDVGRRTAIAVALALGVAGMSLPAVAGDEDLWPSLRKEVFGERAIVEGDGLIVIDAPERAEDAAIVPITMRVPPSVKGALKSLTLIIDQNPAPVAAAFTFGPAAGDGGGERRMTTRVRIDTYSYVRAIVETSDGTLHMAKTFVKASGGCSAPAPKDIDGASSDLGKIVVKSFDPALETTPLREAQIMIRHPNINGLQMDPVTRAYTPARFVKTMTVNRGEDLVFRVETSISISSDPHYRFTYANTKNNELDVVAIDTDETEFKGETRHKGL